MEWLAPLVGFIFISTITPGPNNVLLAASGIRFGVRRTIPHIVGIHMGMYSLSVLCGLGLGQLIVSVPEVLTAMKIFATGYLAYLAWKILGFQLQGESEVSRPMNIAEAWLFQFSNPKAWMMVTTGLSIALAINQDMIVAVVALCLGFVTLGTVCNLTWVYLGASVSRFLRDPGKVRWVNGGLSVITVLTITLFWLQ